LWLHRKVYKNFFHPSLVLLFLDPGSGMGKNPDPASGINIPDPPHCLFSFKFFGSFLNCLSVFFAIFLFRIICYYAPMRNKAKKPKKNLLLFCFSLLRTKNEGAPYFRYVFLQCCGSGIRCLLTPGSGFRDR
jgi:hypothetical protein